MHVTVLEWEFHYIQTQHCNFLKELNMDLHYYRHIHPIAVLGSECEISCHISHPTSSELADYTTSVSSVMAGFLFSEQRIKCLGHHTGR